METNKIREYVMVKDDFSHAKLEEIGCYDYYGELKYTEDIYNMLNRSFRMDSLITEVSYVIALDHRKMPKGICKIGQGGLGETPTPMQPLFTFLLLTGASSFVVVHNHISYLPNPSEADKAVTGLIEVLSNTFTMEFIGHMIINPHGYVICGGTLDGVEAELDEDGELIVENAEEEIESECVEKNNYETVEELYKAVKKMREEIEGR